MAIFKNTTGKKLHTGQGIGTELAPNEETHLPDDLAKQLEEKGCGTIKKSATRRKATDE
jgi:hypothetical protein